MLKNTFFKSIAGMLLLLAVPQVTSGQKVGTTAMQFLKVPPTARAVGMGAAYSALAGGASAQFWNPAGLTQVGGHEISVDRVEWLLDTSHNAIAYAGAFGKLGYFGVHLYTTNVGTIQETRVDNLGFEPTADGGRQFNPGLTGNTFSPGSYLIGISYARQFTDRFSAGLTGKYAYEDLYLESTGVPLFDFGMTYNTGYKSLRLAASVLNFGPPVKYSDESYPAPQLFRIGVAVDILGADGFYGQQTPNSRLTVAYDLIQPNDYDQQSSAGLEYAFLDRFALRGGYQFNFDTESFSLGAGIRQPLGSLVLSIDYAYSDTGEFFQAIHRFSLSVGFND